MRASLMVWLATAPLTIQAFHILSPWAVPLNLVLFLPLAVALQSGFALLLLGDVCPVLVAPLAAACQASLRAMLVVVQIAADCPGGHFWLPEPGVPAVIGAYICLALAWTAPRWQRRFRRFAYAAALGCLIVGWSHQVWTRHRALDNGLKCTVLSVGHGNCVVLQWPGGPVWLYDAGCRGAIPFGVDRVARYLWSQGIWRIDTIVLSHADVDHYSLIPGLLERFGAQRICLGPEPLSTANFAEAWLQSELRRHRLATQTLAAGDRLVVGHRGSVEVLHPPVGLDWTNDNARSLVLEVRCDGTSLLLPGDLEADGLDALLRAPRQTFDVAMAPHHGSLASEPRRFLRWCRPRWCIISASDAPLLNLWASHAAEVNARALHTAVHGAVEIELGRRGARVQTFRGSLVELTAQPKAQRIAWTLQPFAEALGRPPNARPSSVERLSAAGRLEYVARGSPARCLTRLLSGASSASRSYGAD
jgi:competence protein ComEC